MNNIKLRLLVLLVGLALSGLSHAAFMNLDPLPGVTFPGGSGQSEFGRLLGNPSGGWTNGAAGRTVYVGDTLLKHPSAAIRVPVMLRASPGAALRLASVAFGHPVVIAAVGAYGVYQWFKDEQLEVINGEWKIKEDGLVCISNCKEYNIDHQTFAHGIWHKSAAAAANYYISQRDGWGGYYARGMYFSSPGQICMHIGGNGVSDQITCNYVLTRNIPPYEELNIKDVGQAEFENLLKNKIVSPELLNGWPTEQIPESTIPVDLPVINPDSSERPSTKTQPIGSPVPSNPQTTPPTWKTPIIEVKPWNDPSKPWQVDAKPGDYVKLNPYPIPDPDKPPWDASDPNNPNNNPNPNPAPWLDPNKPPWDANDPNNPNNQPNPNPYPNPTPNPNPDPYDPTKPSPNPNPDPVPNDPTNPDPIVNPNPNPNPDPNTGTQPAPKGLCDQYPNIPACKAPTPSPDWCLAHPQASACKPFSQFCVENPGILACAKLDDVPPAETLPHREVSVTVTPVPFVNQASCPAPLTFTAFGVAHDISYQPLCDQMTLMRALVLAIAGVLAAYILADSFRVT